MQDIRKTHIRSQKPPEVVQEVYGLLLGHWTVRTLIFQAATSVDVAPLRLSFTGTLRVIRRALPKFQRLLPTRTSLFLSWLTLEILDQVFRAFSYCLKIHHIRIHQSRISKLAHFDRRSRFSND